MEISELFFFLTNDIEHVFLGTQAEHGPRHIPKLYPDF